MVFIDFIRQELVPRGGFSDKSNGYAQQKLSKTPHKYTGILLKKKGVSRTMRDRKPDTNNCEGD